MIPRNHHSRHHHRLRLEKVTTGVLTGQTVYHFRCREAGCHWPFWCFKWEFWGLPPHLLTTDEAFDLVELP